MLVVLTYSGVQKFNMEPRKNTFENMFGAASDDQPVNKRQRGDGARINLRSIISSLTPNSLPDPIFRSPSNLGEPEPTNEKSNPGTMAGGNAPRATRSSSKAAASRAANALSLGTPPATRPGGRPSLFGGAPQARHQHAASAKNPAPKAGASKQEGEKATGNEKGVMGNMAEGKTSETNPGSAQSPVEVEVSTPAGT